MNLFGNTVTAQPPAGLPLAARVRQASDDQPGGRRAQRTVDAERFEQRNQSHLLHGPKPHLLDADAARTGQRHRVGVDVHIVRRRIGRLAQPPCKQQRRDTLRFGLHRRGHVVDQRQLTVEQVLDARAQPRPRLGLDLECRPRFSTVRWRTFSPRRPLRTSRCCFSHSLAADFPDCLGFVGLIGHVAITRGGPEPDSGCVPAPAGARVRVVDSAWLPIQSGGQSSSKRCGWRSWQDSAGHGGGRRDWW